MGCNTYAFSNGVDDWRCASPGAQVFPNETNPAAYAGMGEQDMAGGNIRGRGCAGRFVGIGIDGFGQKRWIKQAA